MRPKQALKKTADNLRTAPVGLTQIAAGIATPAVEFLGGGISAMEDPWIVGWNLPAAVLVYIGLLNTKGAFKMRKEIEKVIEDRGTGNFTLDYMLNRSTHFWCHRQAARVVCRNAGILEQYEKICARHSDIQRDSWIPHC